MSGAAAPSIQHQVIVLIDKHYGDYVEDAKSYTRLFHLALQVFLSLFKGHRDK